MSVSLQETFAEEGEEEDDLAKDLQLSDGEEEEEDEEDDDLSLDDLGKKACAIYVAHSYALSQSSVHLKY